MKKKSPPKPTLAKGIKKGIRKVKALDKTMRKKRASSRKKSPSPKKARVGAVNKRTEAKTNPPIPEQKSDYIPGSRTPLEEKASPAQTEQESVEVSKFTAVGTLEEESKYSLPHRYNDNRLMLVPRDPWWVHTYWDISEDKINAVVSDIPDYERADLKWVLRMYDVTGVRNFRGSNANSHYDVDINFGVNNWYVNVNAPEKEWCAEIGLKTKKGNFFAVARSNIIKTPYFGISNIVDEEWAMPDEEYFKLLGVYDLGNSSLAAREKGLEEALKNQISSGAFSGNLSSASSLMGRKKEKNFFLEVWTELILYGRTRADATVSVAGKKIKLRSDGTFSSRYALDEGDFRFDVTATSCDKSDSITVVPAVKRYTIK